MKWFEPIQQKLLILLLFAVIIILINLQQSFAQTIYMPVTGSATYTTCSGNFYSDQLNGYSSNCNGKITFTPAQPGKVISIHFDYLDIEDDFDYLYVYNGTSTNAPFIISYSGYYGNLTINADTINNPTGSLTLLFRSDQLDEYTGWSAAISCINEPVSTPPSCIINYSIQDNAHTALNIQQLSWQAVNNVTSYDVYFGTDSLPPLVSLTQTQTFYILPELFPDTTYYYKIVPRSLAIPAIACNVRIFKTSGIYELTHADTIYTCNATLKPIDANTLKIPDAEYRMTFCPDIPGKKIYLDFRNVVLKDYFFYKEEIQLIQGKDSYQNSFFDERGHIQFSDYFISTDSSGCISMVLYEGPSADTNWTIGISCLDTTIAPTGCSEFYYPENASVVSPESPGLYWSNIPNTTGYDIYFGTNSNPPLVSSNQHDLHYLTGLLPDSTYYYKIVPRNPAGIYSNCPVYSFSTDSIYYHQSGIYKVTSGVYFDAGGPGQNYYNNDNRAITFCPYDVTKKIQVDFNFIELNYPNDYLQIFNGNSYQSPLLNTIYGLNNDNTSFISTDTTGCLTFWFISNDLNTAEGWNASIHSVSNSQSLLCPEIIPFQNQDSVSLSTLLKWKGVQGATGYDIYFGSSANPPLVSTDQTTTNYSPDNLLPNTTYYYKISAKNQAGTSIDCQVSSFTTRSSYIIETGSYHICEGNLYDDGGPNGDYQIKENALMTIYPSIPGNMVTVNFDEITLQSTSQYLVIADGDNAQAMGSFHSFDNIGCEPFGAHSFTATNPQGALTIWLSTFNYTNGYLPQFPDTFPGCAGFSATISCSLPDPPILHCDGDEYFYADSGFCDVFIDDFLLTPEGSGITLTYSGQNPGTYFSVGTTTITAYATNGAGVDSCTFNIIVRDTTPPFLNTYTDTIYKEDFENTNPPNWYFDGIAHITNACPVSDLSNISNWVYCGFDSSCNYNDPNNAGYIFAGMYVPLVPGNIQLSFDFTFNLEWEIKYNSLGPHEVDYDQLQLSILNFDGDKSEYINFKNSEYEPDKWLNKQVNLNQFKGDSISLTWSFQIDDINNDFHGFQLDNVEILNYHSCPDDTLVITTTSGQCGSIVNYKSPVAADLCSNVSVICSPPSGSYFNVGSTSVNVVATDGSGNLTHCQFTVNVNMDTSIVEICDNAIDDNCNSLVDEGCNISLNLYLYIQGLYISNDEMVPVLMNAGLSDDNTASDSITVELHSANSPYEFVAGTTAQLSIYGSASMNFPVSLSGNSYYIVVKHRNSIETWSKDPVTIGSYTIYDFTH